MRIYVDPGATEALDVTTNWLERHAPLQAVEIGAVASGMWKASPDARPEMYAVVNPVHARYIAMQLLRIADQMEDGAA